MAHMGNKVQEKAKDTKKALKKLFSYLKSYLPLMIVVLFLVVASTITKLVGPNKLGELTNIVSKSLPEIDKITYEITKLGVPYELSAIWDIGILLIVLYAVGFVLNYVANLLVNKICFNLAKKMRSDISKKIDRLPLKFLDKTPYGNVLSIMTNDVDTVGMTLQSSLSGLVGAIILFLGSLLMMFVTNWIMALSAIASTIIGFVIMALITKNSQKFFVAQANKLGELTGIVEETYSGQRVIKVNNAVSEVCENFENVNSKLYSASWKAQFMSGTMQPLMNFIGNFGYVVVCIVGAILALRGQIEFGVIVSFMIYIRFFTNPLSQIAQSLTSIQSAAAASERIFNFLDETELEDESNKTAKVPKKIKGNVEIENVAFGYTRDKEIIHNFSASVKAGQKIAIVGPTGAGKTTIVNLLMRFYEMDKGDIKIDSISIHDMTRTDLRNIFSMVLQDTWLFDGTIRENIVFNKKNVTEKQIKNAIKASNLEHFVSTLPNGLNTILSDETAISVGQKQLLTIARAMIQNCPMLILDEATSNVDTRTEELIQNAMDKLMKNRTSFVIAHRLSTIKNADLILYLEDGDVVEQGCHEELMKKNGKYAKLYNSQFKNA